MPLSRNIRSFPFEIIIIRERSDPLSNSFRLALAHYKYAHFNVLLTQEAETEA